MGIQYTRLGLGGLILAALGAPAVATVDEQGDEIKTLQSGLNDLHSSFIALQDRIANDESVDDETRQSVANMAADLQSIATALPRGAAVVDAPDATPGEGPLEPEAHELADGPTEVQPAGEEQAAQTGEQQVNDNDDLDA